MLARVLGGERPVLTPSVDDPGHAKLLVTQAALTLRRNQPHRFTTYAPVTASGEAAGHVLAFDRGGALSVATRLPVGLAARGWGDTVVHLPGRVGGPTCSPAASTPVPRRHASCWRTLRSHS